MIVNIISILTKNLLECFAVNDKHRNYASLRCVYLMLHTVCKKRFTFIKLLSDTCTYIEEYMLLS